MKTLLIASLTLMLGACTAAQIQTAGSNVAAVNGAAVGALQTVATSIVAACPAGEAFATRLEAGHTAVNGMTASDPRLPFGGIKDSGYGRELSRYGIQEFVNVHAVVTYGPHGPDHADQAAVE